MWEQYTNLVDGPKLAALVILLLVNLFLGVIVAIKTGTFNLKKFGGFVGEKVMFILGYLVVGAVALIDDVWKPVVTLALAGVIATYIGFITQNLKELGWKWFPSVTDLITGKTEDQQNK
ncbi:MAG: phage holin family protein [Dehalococcoidales bacterium]|nr:phage holin family protein [Dehalococcoidales bacterium]